jgi:hypothetical protein
MAQMIFATRGKTHFTPPRTHLSRLSVFRVGPMKMRFTGVVLAAAVASLALAAGAGAELISLYRNPMESKSQRAEPVKLSGSRCQGGGTSHVFRIVVGKGTKECSYRTPVIGRDLQVAATMRLLSTTPKSLRPKVFLALNLRAGGGARYQLAVYPLQRKTQLRKYLADGEVKYLKIEQKVPTVQGVDKANELRLRAFNVTSGPDKGSCRILAFVGGEPVGDFTDRAAGELQGRASGFAVGAAKNAKGAVASVDDVIVRAPSPF